MARTRQFEFIVGPETSTLPTSGTPTESDDTVTLGFANDHYVQGGAPVADLTALKAVASADRADNDALWVDAENAFFVFDSASSTTGDDLTVVEPTSGTGRWVRASRNPVIAASASFRNQAETRYYEQSGSGTNYVGFKAPDAVTANKIFKLPDGDGSSNQVLKTDGSGALGWATVATVEQTIDAAAGTSGVTLVTGDESVHVFTPSSAITVKLDNSYAAGREVTIVNDGTAEITLTANNDSTIAIVYRKSVYRVMCKSSTPANSAAWLGLSTIVSPWIDISSSITVGAGFGTVTGKLVYYKRNGSEVFINGVWANGTVGTGGAYIDVPSSLAIDTTYYSGTSAANLLGGWHRAGGGAIQKQPMFFKTASGPQRIYFTTVSSGNVFGESNGESVSGTGNLTAFELRYNVSGWSVTKG